MSERDFDLVVYGATGFVGQLLVKSLRERAKTEKFRWAIAARNEGKLKALVSEKTPVPTLVASADDPDSLQRLCQKARVVISTVGPYNRYGEPLIKACVESGTDYIDLCGEVPWLHAMQSRYAKRAETSGSRLIYACGFDSVPSDLGVLLLQKRAYEGWGLFCQHIKLRVLELRGSLSGGTLASMTDSAALAAASPNKRKLAEDPYALALPCPQARPTQDARMGATKDPQFRGWMAPFLMEPLNSRVVHRTNSLMDFLWGPDFLYDEAMYMGEGLQARCKAMALSTAFALTQRVAAIGPLRRLMHRTILPKPGQGPSPKEQAEGMFRIELWGRVDQDKELRLMMHGNQDPGYAATAHMLTHAGLCLAFERPRSELAGGFWTPATALGLPYAHRLHQSGTIRFDPPPQSPVQAADQGSARA